MIFNDGEDEPVGVEPFLTEEAPRQLKEGPRDDNIPPRYLLKQRSLIESSINDLRDHYRIPQELDKELDELVFAYDKAINALVLSVDRWKTQRGSRLWAVHGCLAEELPNLIALEENANEAKRAGAELRGFLQGMEPKGRHWLPDYMTAYNKFQADPKIKRA